MHLPQDDIFTFEVQVRLSDIKDDMANGKIWPIKIAASNGKVAFLIELIYLCYVSRFFSQGCFCWTEKGLGCW